ncbi:Tripartite DNA replication factor [Mortierella alpina]|nr:Tripartite DNA replication factor [Mortierella alpina]
MPKLTKNASSSNLSRSKSSTSLKKTSSFKSDSKLSQASLSSFFAKTRPQDVVSTALGPPGTSQTPSSKAAAPTTSKPAPPSVALPSTIVSGGINKGKAPRRIIIDDDEEEETSVRSKPTVVARPMRRTKVENPFITSTTTTVDARARKTSDLSKLALPFEERMPVSPPDSPAPAPALTVPQDITNAASVAGQGEKPNEVPLEIPQHLPKESLDKSNRRPEEEQEVRASSSTSAASSAASSSSSSTDLTKTTPSKRRQSPIKTTPQRTSRAPSPFRTPTEKSKRALLPMESLGLSPEDSVFWAKTPPSEAWKKLKNMDTGRSHEEEAASIIGRLYETSSAGTALQTMDRRPKDRIREMLNTMRGSSEGLDQGLDDEDDDLETMDQSSPTKELVDRHRSNAARQHGLSRYHSAQDLGATIRKRGRRVAPAVTKPAPMPFLSPSKRRNDVLKMIEQIQENMSGSSDSTCLSAEEPPPSKRVHLDQANVENCNNAASGSNPHTRTPTRTPTRNRSSNPQPSPGDFDDMFTDLDMDDNAFEELTQLERSSTCMSSASASSFGISSPFSSVASSAGRSMSNVRRELADLGVSAPSHSQPTTCSIANQSTLPFDKPDASVGTNTDLAVDDFDDLDDLGDDFDLYDLDDPKAVRIEGAKYKRYTVNDVKDGIMDPRWQGKSKVLMLQELRSENVVRIFLRESWVASNVSVGDIVHVIRPYLYTTDIGVQDLMLEDAQGFLVVKPDYLVPTSALAESFSCVRKPIIDIRAKKTDESNIPMIHGIMLHELFQQSLLANDFTTASMEARMDAIIKDHINDLCLVNESLETAKESIMQQIGSCQDFARRYLQATPRPDGTIDESMGFADSGNTSTLCINKILDIEENIWSPMFGLKGKIDASVQVLVKTSKKNGGAADVETRTLTVPFELKTGKRSNVVSHRAQTMLYTLLMTDRYDVDVQWGLLFYLKTGEFIRVPAPHDEIRTILMQRNEIAFYEEQKLALPPMAKSTSTCRRCFSFSSCTVLHKLLEDGTGETSGIGTMFDEATDHLNETHVEFMRKWNRLLALEQGDVAKFQSQIWTMLSAERLAAGNCFSNLQLIKELDDDGHDIHERRGSTLASLAAFTGHRYRFKLSTPIASPSQQTLSQTLRGGNSLLSSNISVGDPIVVSSENQHYALAIGQVLDLSLSEITVGLDRALLGPPMKLAGYDREWNQAYRGLMDIAAKPPTVIQRGAEDYHTHLSKNRITFRIDKDEMMAGLARTRNNLVQLFRSDVHGGDAKRRHLVVDLAPPAFDPVEETAHDNADLNDDQRRAIDAVLSARDYALILGMPGTGKTTTIAHIIHTLVARGKSVLLTSYTHSAVDNVLLKLNEGINIVRLGNKEKVHRDIRGMIPDFTEPPLNNVEAIQNFYGRCQVVGTTCLGIGDPIFMAKRFDYCIVDEASQITLPACLGPIRFADVFVLVGDHNQLPPLVKNPEAKKDGFDLSLFRMLSDRHPQSVTSLTQQYRMNQDVMLLSNTLVYKNQLRCANDEVAHKVLEIPAMARFRRHCHPLISTDVFSDDRDTVAANGCQGHSASKPCWLEQCLDPQRSVVFIDTDDVPAHEVQVGQSTQNPTEALLVRQLTEALISGGVAEDDIGIISVLRAQLKVLGRLLRSRPLLDIHTVDRYQGKDKECVIVSLVRSNAEQHVGELLKDWRRINVAFTRAKRKLVIFGSRQTLQGSPVFEQFLKLMEQQDWILKIAAQAQHQHPSLSASWSSSSKPLSSSLSSHVQPVVRTRKGPGGRPTLLERLIDERDEAGNEDDDEEEVDKENMERAALVLKDARARESKGLAGSKGARVIRAKPEAVLRAMPICKNILDSL